MTHVDAVRMSDVTLDHIWPTVGYGWMWPDLWVVRLAGYLQQATGLVYPGLYGCRAPTGGVQAPWAPRYPHPPPVAYRKSTAKQCKTVDNGHPWIIVIPEIMDDSGRNSVQPWVITRDNGQSAR